MCQTAASGDCQVANFVYSMHPGACVPASCKGTVVTPCMLTRDVIAFSVELSTPRDFDTGQFTIGIAGMMSILERACQEHYFDAAVTTKGGGHEIEQVVVATVGRHTWRGRVAGQWRTRCRDRFLSNGFQWRRRK